MRRLLSLVVIAAGLAAPGHASAQNKAAADAVFKEGKRLLAKGDTAAACTKFEGSLKLMEQLGVRLNLGDCYERLGKLSAAYAEFRTAEMAARRTGDRRAKFASDRLAALESRMPYLTVKLTAGADIAGLVVVRDGQALDRSLFDTSLPVDPGGHVVTASAPGRRPWSHRIEAAEGTQSSVVVPVLQPEPQPVASGQTDKPVSPVQPVSPGQVPAPTTTRPPEPEEDEAPSLGRPGGTARTLGTVFAITGGGLVVTGLLFGAKAQSKWSDAQAGHCDDSGNCDEVGYPLLQEARSAGNKSTVFVVVGAAAMTTGIVLAVKGIRAGRRAAADADAGVDARLSPVLHPEGAGLAIMGRF